MVKNEKIKSGIIIGVLLAILIIVIIFINNKKIFNKEALAITNNNLKVSATGITKTNILEETITIKNKSNKTKKYNLEWQDVANNYKNQNQLTYTVEASGNGARNIGRSQIPVIDFVLLEDITIEANSTHIYSVKAVYETTGETEDTSDSSFTGYLVVKEK